MVFNMGLGKVGNPNAKQAEEKTGTGIRQYSNMLAAIKARDFRTAANESRRTNFSDKPQGRNNAIKQWFMRAEFAEYHVAAAENLTETEWRLFSGTVDHGASAVLAALASWSAAWTHYEVSVRHVGNGAAFQQACWSGLMTAYLGAEQSEDLSVTRTHLLFRHSRRK